MRVLQRLIVDGYLNVYDVLYFRYRGKRFSANVTFAGIESRGRVHETLSKWVSHDIMREFGTKPRFSAWANVRVHETGATMHELRAPACLPDCPFERILTSYFAPRVV